MKVVATEKAPKALGPYSQGYVHAGVLYTAGQIAIDPAVNDVTATTIEEQTEQVCKNLGEVLKEAGTDFAHVLKTTCFLLNLQPLPYCVSLRSHDTYNPSGILR